MAMLSDDESFDRFKKSKGKEEWNPEFTKLSRQKNKKQQKQNNKTR